MAVQTAVPTTLNLTRAQTPEKAAGASGGESFYKLLGLVKESHAEFPASLGDAAERAEDFTEDLSEEELEGLIAPLLTGTERLRDFADAVESELSEGDVKGAIDFAGRAVEKVSRFDPDLVLGSDFANGPLHSLIREFLDKYALGKDGGEQTSAAPEETAELPQANPEAEIDLGAEKPEASASSESPEKAINQENLEKEITTDKPVLRGSEPEIPEAADDDALEALLRNAQFLERLTPAVKSEEHAEASIENGDEAGRERGDVLERAAAARSGIESEAGSLRKIGDEAAAGKERGEAGQTRERASKKADSQVKAQNRDAAIGVRDDESALPKAGSFASELTNAARSESGAPAPITARPAVTYSLDAGNPFGDGVRSVLEFMRNDGVNEARIVVEPPALGRVDVSLQASGSGVEAVFKVDNEALKQMLQQNLDALKTSLEAQGIHVSNLAVDIRNRDDQKGRGDLYGTRGRTRRVPGADSLDGDAEELPALARIDLEKGLLHWVA